MNIQQKLLGLEEDVRGIIIGEVNTPYQFWTKPDEYGWQKRIANYSAPSDTEAVAWFKETYPEHFARGVEMRVFDV